MRTPAEILRGMQLSLGAMHDAIHARAAAEQSLSDYLTQRAAETQAERKRREDEIEGLKSTERNARDAAARAKAELDSLVKAVETDVELDLPPPAPDTPEAAAAEIAAKDRRIAELEASVADAERRAADAAAALDAETQRLKGAVS